MLLTNSLYLIQNTDMEKKVNPRKEYFAAYNKKNKRKNHEKYLKNKEKQIESSKKRYREKRDEILKLHREKYYNRDENTEYLRGYRDKNRIKYNNYTKNWIYNNRKNNIGARIKDYLRGRIRSVLKGGLKFGKLHDLLGCDIDFFKQHIESKFTEGMTWENYGEWHIDHKIPCAVFDLSKEEAQKICFHYSNLQPLWGIDNKKKGSFVDVKYLETIRVDLLNFNYINNRKNM